jgi:fused signal recognition particle receptor
VEQALRFSEAVQIDGIVLTKLDADTKGGSAVSMAVVIKRPILFATVGQDYEDIISFEPDQMVHNILG